MFVTCTPVVRGSGSRYQRNGDSARAQRSDGTLDATFGSGGKASGNLIPNSIVTEDTRKIVVLGDVVYLRWERDGKVQEDSLLFSKEGQRLEGTFVNSQGGWGSVSGKRTASCTP